MVISPTTVSMPLIPTSVNVQTEQVARDNRVREPIAAAAALAKSNAERKIKSDDKRQRHSAWDPSEHPGYEEESEVEDIAKFEISADPVTRLFDLLALRTYSKNQGHGYTIRFRLPKRILDAAIREGLMTQRRQVIKYHYGHSVVPHFQSGVLAVL